MFSVYKWYLIVELPMFHTVETTAITRLLDIAIGVVAFSSTEDLFLGSDPAPRSQSCTGPLSKPAGRTELCVVGVRVAFLESSCLTASIAVSRNRFAVRWNSTYAYCWNGWSLYVL